MTEELSTPFVFVLMPFSNEFKDVYYLGIKPACEKIGANAQRADEEHIFMETILEKTLNVFEPGNLF